MGIGVRELLIILVIALILFGAKKLRSVGSGLGAAVRGFKKAVNEGEEETSRQIKVMAGKESDCEEREGAVSPDRKTTVSGMSAAAPTEIALIFAIALLVLGPERLPKLAADLGRWAGRARAMARQLRAQLEQEAQY